MPVFFKKSDTVLIQLNSKKDWDEFYKLCDGFLLEHDHSRLYLYLKDVVKTIVLEKNHYDADYRDTYYNFFSRKFANYPSKTIRANFFSNIISKKNLIDLDKYKNEYIGFTIIRPNRISSIGRTILDPYKLPNIKGSLCIAEYPVHILGAELVAKGFPYMSQDTDVTICAHAACWMTFRYFSQRYTRYAEIWPYEVTQLTHDVSHGRLVPSKGITVWQITEMFSEFGFYPETYIRDDSPYSAIFIELLYMYIESGIPVVATLDDPAHAVTVIGHYSDYSKATAGGSHNFVEGFIINDDNHMPYQVMKNNARFMGSKHMSKHEASHIDSFVVPLYEKVHLSAEHVKDFVKAILANEELGIAKLSKKLNPGDLVTRTFLTSSKSYKQKRRGGDGLIPYGISGVYAEMSMPKFIWVCEISTPDLFQEKKIIGEILFDATSNQRDMFSFLSIHYPDFLLLNDRNCLTKAPSRFMKFAIDKNVDESYIYNCYISNLKDVS